MEYDVNESNEPSNFRDGESKAVVAANISIDPMEYIIRCRDHRTRSVREVVLSAVAAIEGIDAVKDDKETFAQFLRGLAVVKMISSAEADKVDLSKMPTISKLRKIVQHKDVLHSTVADKMCVSYSGAYELAMLIEALPSNGDVTSQLASHLDKLDGPLTRKWLMDRRQLIAPKPLRKTAAVVPTEKAAATVADGATNVDEASPPQLVAVSRSPAIRPATVTADMEGAFSGLLVKLITTAEDVNNIDPEDSPRYDLSENALVLVQADMMTLLEQGAEIAGSYKVDRFVGIYLTECPIAPDVTANEAIAVYERGDSLIEGRQIVWPSGADAASVVDSLLDGIRSHTVSRVVSHEVADW